MATDPLSLYNKKRDFSITAEPKGKAGRKSSKELRFVIQLHEATRTHYDFRLEWHGVMKSWAVTKGPSYDPADKRLAVRTEDHPVSYNDFEGVIPDRQYGAGPVMIWDEGVWKPEGDPEKMEKKGHINFTIEGSRMKGHWHLVRMKTKEKRENWLLIKGSDEFVLSKTKNAALLKSYDTSAVTGRTMAQIRKAGIGNTTHVKKASKKAVKKEKVETGKAAPSKSPALNALMKKYGAPELATLVEGPPTSADWVHEIKYDGYRLMAFIAGGQVILRTRGMKDWTHKFGPLAKALLKLKLKSAVLDLEACVADKNGRTDFSALQAALSDENPEKIEGYVFDLLHLDGSDYAREDLAVRKKSLATLMKKKVPSLHYSEHFESSPDLLAKACRIGAEGLISKRKDSAYHARRTKDWLKSKCSLEQEFVIGGFMPAKDYDKAVGALLLGYYKNKKFTYAGKVGTGFSRQSAKDIYKKLIALKTDSAPFTEKRGKGLREYVYVRPEMMCEVFFVEWTPDGHIRHGSFKGLREDKNPKSVREEVPKKASTSEKSGVDMHGVTITHPERVVYPGTKITKGDIAAYYAKVAPLMMPFIEGRLVSLLRCTDGIGGQCFFQRNPMKGMGSRIRSKAIARKGAKHDYIYVDDEKGLLQLTQMGTIEFHGWQSRVDGRDKPDQIIFDLDPDEGVPFDAVKLAAQDIRGRLKKMGLISFARLSGGKGIHVVVPVKPVHKWDEVKEFARAFAENMAKDAPDAYVANMSKKKRTGKIFIDFFRNDFSSTAVVPFSLRAREAAPIAWPVSWEELKKRKSAAGFHLDALTKQDFSKARKQVEAFFAANQRLKIPG